MTVSAAEIENYAYIYHFEQEADPNGTINYIDSSKGATLSESNLHGPAVTVSLSPAANAMMARSEVAVELLGGVQSEKPADNSAKFQNVPSHPAGTSAGGNVADVTTANSATATSDAGYIEDLKQSLSQNRSAIFADYVKRSGGPAAWANALNPAEVASFVAAYNSGQVTIQTGDERPDLGITQNTSFTANGDSESVNWNQQAVLATDAADGTYTEAITYAGVGALVISLSQNAAATASS